MRGFAVLTAGLALLLATAACGGGGPTATPVPEAAAPSEESPRIRELKAASEAKGLRFLTHDEIVAGAQREGKLLAIPGFDDSNFPAIKEAFEAAYPFIELTMQAVGGTHAGERLNLEMLSGRAEVDVLEAGSDDWALYGENQLLLPYDYEAMALAGELAINPEGILHTPAGQLPFFGAGLRVIAYNTDLISEEDAPKTWDDCIHPRFKGLVATDTKTSLDIFLGEWTEREILDYAKALKDNDVIFVRGNTATLVRLLSGEIAIICPASYHAALRQLIADPNAPMALVLPDPLVVTPREQEGIYAGAENPHAALLWMEWLSLPEVQLEILSKNDPGKASYLIEGTVPYNLIREFEGTVQLCDAECLVAGPAVAMKIVVDAWGFPRIGTTPP